MSLITTLDLGKAYGPDDIFSGISISIPKHARIGLVGANGVGKTTLLRLMVGLEEPSNGSVQRAKGLRLGYLPQEASFETQHTLWGECQNVFADLIARQEELNQLELAMEKSEQVEEALEIYGDRLEVFERLGGYTYETQIRRTITGLGFVEEDFKRPIRQLSGGQRTRALLAMLLLSNPDVLLLDEPTNHLDIGAIEWLEAFFREWTGAMVCVSHDRYFLDQVTNTIWEMTPGVEIYRGNYSAYLHQRSERYQQYLEEYQSQQAFIEKEEDFIRRNIAGQKTRQAQGRRKRLERLLEEAKLTLPQKQRGLKLSLKAANRSGDLVLRTYGLKIGYADEGKPLFSVPDLVLQRGECVAILGPNGAGKTTFLKTLLDEIPPLQGEVLLGASLNIGYFAQAHEKLRAERTLIDEIQMMAPKMLPGEIRNYLARFLFMGEDVFKLVGILSGGERGRLALACLALSDANLLLLDEPTNHLDLPSQEVLQGVISDYTGTVLLVTHDRYLVDALANQIWEVVPSEGELRVFKGSYSEYKTSLRTLEETKQRCKAESGSQTKSQKHTRPELLTMKEERQRQQMAKVLEKDIAELEAKLAIISRQLENPPVDIAEVNRLGVNYQQLRQDLEKRLEEWAELS